MKKSAPKSKKSGARIREAARTKKLSSHNRQGKTESRPKMKQLLRHVTSINDLTNEEIKHIFAAAERYLQDFGHFSVRHRIARSAKSASGKILATLFYEPSTRTRLSFESATLRLGGGTISSSDPATSSAAKGESLADTVRVISSYADALVIRHPRDGAAKFAAEFAEIPVINGGDGSHEHPTQTLCDLFTLRKEKSIASLKNLNVVISGDLKGSRTIHSFVYALARFEANIELLPGAKGMELPVHVAWRLRNELHQKLDASQRGDVDVIYVTADQSSHQQQQSSDFLGVRRFEDHVDIVYMTRFQKERWAEVQRKDYMKVDRNFLKEGKFQNASVLHPLPRIGELDAELDNTPRAAYFRQAAYGVPVRMALIAGLLELEHGPSIKKFEGGFEAPEYRVHAQPRDVGIGCPNTNCITHDEQDGKYAGNKFYIVREDRLRCFYCEIDVENVVMGRKGGHDAYFASEEAARTAGYKVRKHTHIAAAE